MDDSHERLGSLTAAQVAWLICDYLALQIEDLKKLVEQRSGAVAPMTPLGLMFSRLLVELPGMTSVCENLAHYRDPAEHAHTMDMGTSHFPPTELLHLIVDEIELVHGQKEQIFQPEMVVIEGSPVMISQMPRAEIAFLFSEVLKAIRERFVQAAHAPLTGGTDRSALYEGGKPQLRMGATIEGDDVVVTLQENILHDLTMMDQGHWTWAQVVALICGVDLTRISCPGEYGVRVTLRCR